MGPEPRAPRAFSTAEVARLAGISSSTVRRWVAHGLLQPGRGPRGHRFSWADLSRARGWSSFQSLPVTRIARALAQSTDPAAVRLRAVGRTIALTDAQGVFEADTGQSLLSFEERAGSVRGILSGRGWRAASGAAQRRGDPEQALAVVQEYLCAHPEDAAAWSECAAMHHLRGALHEAAGAYERSVGASTGAARARGLFNLGVVHEDAADDEAASRAYAAALALLPDFADAHFNAARVWERLGDRWRALRHLHAYRRCLR